MCSPTPKLHLSLRHAIATMIGLINCLQQYDAAVALQSASEAAFRSASEAYAQGFRYADRRELGTGEARRDGAGPRAGADRHDAIVVRTRARTGEGVWCPERAPIDRFGSCTAVGGFLCNVRSCPNKRTFLRAACGSLRCHEQMSGRRFRSVPEATLAAGTSRRPCAALLLGRSGGKAPQWQGN